MPAFVEFQNVFKTYKMGEIEINAVNDVSFAINEGEFAVVVGQTLVDGNGEGLAAVIVDHGGQILADRVVDDELAALIGDGDAVVIGQVTDELVSRVVRPPGSGGEVAADFGGRAIDNGSLLRRACAFSKSHSGRRNEHGTCQKHRKKLLHG